MVSAALWASRRRRKKKSPGSPAGQEHPLVYLVGVADDGTLGSLAENLGEPHGGHHLAADEVGKQVARPHGGQLIRVAHQYQAAVVS